MMQKNVFSGPYLLLFSRYGRFKFSAKNVSVDQEDLKDILSDTACQTQFFMKSSKNEYLSK